MTDVWILGGTGRSARAITTELRHRGIRPVLVGRDAGRLEAVADGMPTVVAGSIGETADAIRRERPAVVVNTIGPFTDTAKPLLDACLPSSDYPDLANDLAAVAAALGFGDTFAAAGRIAVTGAGIGVTATESIVMKLCEGRPAARRVRVDMVPCRRWPSRPVPSATRWQAPSWRVSRTSRAAAGSRAGATGPAGSCPTGWPATRSGSSCPTVRPSPRRACRSVN